MLWINLIWSAWYVGWASYFHLSQAALDPRPTTVAILIAPVLVRFVLVWTGLVPWLMSLRDLKLSRTESVASPSRS
jgi:hypothetical protein